MKWAILGASSFTGGKFARYLDDRGEAVLRLGRIALDINKDVRQMISLIDMFQADYVVNFISKSLVAESWDAPLDWYQTNVISTIEFVEKLKRFPIKRYVHVSTPEVYGSGWWTEEAAFRPTTPYAASRACADMHLIAMFKAHGFPVVFTRSANVYGPGQTKRIIPIAIDAKRAGTKIKLQGGGTSRRSFVHIDDVCAATKLIAEQGVNGNAYHISRNETYSIREVVDMIGCKYEDAPARLAQDHEYKLCTAKLQLLGYQCNITLEQGLCELQQSA